MSSKSQTSAAEEEAKSMLMPKLRFPEFRGAEGWGERPLSEFMSESRLPGSKGNVAKKITVKLWGNGVFEKNDAIQGSINTQYFRRNAGQFIYSKLDFLNQAFGIVPPSLDGFESTVDLPCFDFADGLIPAFLLEYVKRRDFYERLGETADGSRKARRIHAETFLSFPIALPSPAEQQKIADQKHKEYMDANRKYYEYYGEYNKYKYEYELLNNKLNPINDPYTDLFRIFFCPNLKF